MFSSKLFNVHFVIKRIGYDNFQSDSYSRYMWQVTMRSLLTINLIDIESIWVSYELTLNLFWFVIFGHVSDNYDSLWNVHRYLGHINSKNSNRNLCRREQPTYDSNPNVSTNRRGKWVAKPVFKIWNVNLWT